METLSRRGLLRKFIPRMEVTAPDAGNNPPIELHLLSRRTFLRSLLVLGGALVGNQLLSEKVSAHSPDPQPTNYRPSERTVNVVPSNYHRTRTPYVDFANSIYLAGLINPNVLGTISSFSDTICQRLGARKGSYKETFIQSMLMVSVALSTDIGLNLLGIRTGNAGSDEVEEGEYAHYIRSMSPRRLFERFIEGSVGYPLAEEAIFRLFPSFLIDTLVGRNKKRYWRVGIPGSVLFGVVHSIGTDPNDNLVLESLPVTQTMGGLFQWYLMREKGFSHAVLAHGAHNAALFILDQAINRLIPT